MMLPAAIATSTYTTFLDSIFTNTINMTIYVLTVTWPYILAAAFLWFIYRVAKSAFKG